jgi:hypothetical protein
MFMDRENIIPTLVTLMLGVTMIWAFGHSV